MFPGISITFLLDEAISAFRAAVRLTPKGSELHYWLGVVLAEKREYKAAIKEHREAISLSEKEDERLFISLDGILYEESRITSIGDRVS